MMSSSPISKSHAQSSQSARPSTDCDDVQILSVSGGMSQKANQFSNSSAHNSSLDIRGCGRKGLPMIKMKKRPKKNERIVNSESDNGATSQSSESDLKESPQTTMNQTAMQPKQGQYSASDQKAGLSSPAKAKTMSTAHHSTPSPSTSRPSPQRVMSEPRVSASSHQTADPKQRSPTTDLVSKSSHQTTWPKGEGSFELSSDATNTPPFSWDAYLSPDTPIAPREAFMQSQQLLKNEFQVGMKLEAKDPRNRNFWSLATVISLEGIRLGLRMDGCDRMNDFFEIIDSENIRPIRTGPSDKPADILVPPIGYQAQIGRYLNYVEKTLKNDKTKVAPKHCFKETPKRPPKNLFEVGMKLEALDKKNPTLICPATIGEVSGNDIKIIFDGWGSSFDYTCKYYSRDIFPINWCRDTGHWIQPPKGWDGTRSRTNPRLISAGQMVLSEQKKKLSRQSNLTSTPQSSKKPQKRLKKNQSTPTTSKARSPKDRSSTSPYPSTSPSARQASNSSSQDTPSTCPTNRSSFGSSPAIFNEQSLAQELDAHSPIPSRSPISPPLDKLDPKNNLAGDDRYGTCQRTTPYDWTKKSGPNEKEEPTVNEEATSFVSSINDSSASLSKKPRLGRSRADTWTVQEVVDFLESSDESLKKYSKIFLENEIDGKAFMLLTNEVMISHMGFKVGPAVKIARLIEQAKATNYS